MSTREAQENSTEEYSVSYELTPNPASMKFEVSKKITDSAKNYQNAQETDTSPLAAKLFGFPWTSGVFIGENFVVVTKQDWVDWDVLQDPLSGLIKEHLENGSPVIIEISESEINPDFDESDTDFIREIKTALNRDIRPVVALDGGDISFAKYADNILYIKMKGACSGCPSSTATLKQGIEVRMRELFPEIKEVVSI